MNSSKGISKPSAVPKTRNAEIQATAAPAACSRSASDRCRREWMIYACEARGLSVFLGSVPSLARLPSLPPFLPPLLSRFATLAMKGGIEKRTSKRRDTWMWRKRFLASPPFAGTGWTEGGEKSQPFNRFHSRLLLYFMLASSDAYEQVMRYCNLSPYSSDLDMISRLGPRSLPHKRRRQE